LRTLTTWLSRSSMASEPKSASPWVAPSPLTADRAEISCGTEGWRGSETCAGVRSACLDGELYSREGSEGIDAILMARNQPGTAVAFAAFDLLTAGEQDVMAEPWVDRRKRLEDVFAAGMTEARVQLVPTSEDATHLWRVWVVEWGGEGIVLKDRRSPYKPGLRSRAWLKRKEKLTIPVEVLHCAGELIEWGDWGQACVMAFAYHHPRTGEAVTVEQGVRVRAAAEWTVGRGPAEVLCWGVLRSGILRHPVFVGWRRLAVRWT
jgi:ATP dependent DNA ligase-like protein